MNGSSEVILLLAILLAKIGWGMGLMNKSLAQLAQ